MFQIHFRLIRPSLFVVSLASTVVPCGLIIAAIEDSGKERSSAFRRIRDQLRALLRAFVQSKTSS